MSDIEDTVNDPMEEVIQDAIARNPEHFGTSDDSVDLTKEGKVMDKLVDQGFFNDFEDDFNDNDLS
ncbi:hypothetical protein K7432_017350 [Basidiobolus ranarum]|uniref:Uncharacterized protein n=1 Tax=Basidiobolus ranarum TaxID=34480 RepID=A0ABR2VKH8_9FUNG